MNHGDPLAYFITWTIYGTHLQGDLRGWRKRSKGHQPHKPLLKRWHESRLKFPVQILSAVQRRIVAEEIARLSEFRGWHLWETSARSIHVHVAVTAPKYSGAKVRDQLKANCTRVLREHSGIFVDRPVWAVGGDWQCINTEEELEHVIHYIRDAQDRKGLDRDS
ncbi:MAG: hypothetical protein NXI32_30865 [bacterium]|nr:hypothetical protein [bacterium]